MTYDDEKQRVEQLLQSDPSIRKREERTAKRIKELSALPSGEALAKATALALAAAHRKELELEKGAKVTRRERAAMLKAMKAGVDAAAHVALRIKTRQDVPGEMLETARMQTDTLIAELCGCVRENAAGALAIAEQVGEHAMQAVEQAIAVEREKAERWEAAAAETSEKLSAADAPVMTPASLASVAVGEAGEGEKGRPLGRPSTYTDAEADAICQWIADGGSLNRYCKLHGRQASTIYAWMRERVDFARNYAQAHADRTDTFVEDMVEIADQSEKAIDVTQVMSAKLRIETRKWIAERMRPEKYGAKMQVEQKGNVVFQLGVPARRTIDIDPPSTPVIHDGTK